MMEDVSVDQAQRFGFDLFCHVPLVRSHFQATLNHWIAPLNFVIKRNCEQRK